MIERGRVLGFRFDGREYQGHPGDTLASALLANGVRVVARSFKYHRPRSIMTAGIEEPSALVRLETGAGDVHILSDPSLGGLYAIAVEANGGTPHIVDHAAERLEALARLDAAKS